MNFRNLKKLKSSRSLQDSLYKVIARLIVELGLEPGQKVNIEGLASRLGVSRTPIREVLQSLKTEGFVRFIPYVGYIVAEISKKDIEDTYAVRFSLEALAAEQAMRQFTTKDISHIQEILVKTKEFIKNKDKKRIPVFSKKFHYKIYKLSNNKQLQTLLDNIYTKITRYMNILSHEDRLIVIADEQHEKMFYCLRNGDIIGYREALKEHLDFSKTNLIKILNDKYQHYLLEEEQP